MCVLNSWRSDLCASKLSRSASSWNGRCRVPIAWLQTRRFSTGLNALYHVDSDLVRVYYITILMNIDLYQNDIIFLPNISVVDVVNKDGDNKGFYW
jgi:hypothetical protein